MPLRGIFYFSRQFQAFVQKSKADIYSKRLISLPFPQFVIFYNGAEKQEDEFYLRLSDAFPECYKDKTPALECTAKVLNINSGHNEALQNTCKRLHDYSYFIGKVKEFLDEGLPLEVAITAAIDYCIDKDVLADILEKCRSEVFDMLLTKYDAKFHEKCVREEGVEDGISIGLERGRAESERRILTITVNALNSGMTESEIATKLLIPMETIEAAKAEIKSAK